MKMQVQYAKYRWSKKFIFSLAGSALTVLIGSYLISGMADRAFEAGDTREGALLALMSMISLPAGLLCVAMSSWILLFKSPSESAPDWMKNVSR